MPLPKNYRNKDSMGRNNVLITECPRDAMQGKAQFIATDQKIAYLNQLLQVGFETLDCLSFVSPKAIPQMQDSNEVARALQPNGSATKVLAIVLNERGATDAANYDIIHYLGYPLSISASFQKRNGNSSLEQSWERLRNIQEIAQKNRKEPLVYISMAFGNPYGDDYNVSVVLETLTQLQQEGFSQICLADTVGLANSQEVATLYKQASEHFPDLLLGLHLHATSENTGEKLQAAFDAGCRRFDAALLGFGGCPMAGNELVGNVDTKRAITLFDQMGNKPVLDYEALDTALHMANQIFNF